MMKSPTLMVWKREKKKTSTFQATTTHVYLDVTGFDSAKRGRLIVLSSVVKKTLTRDLTLTPKVEKTVMLTFQATKTTTIRVNLVV